jgi:hypothetical protein
MKFATLRLAILTLAILAQLYLFARARRSSLGLLLMGYP